MYIARSASNFIYYKREVSARQAVCAYEAHVRLWVWLWLCVGLYVCIECACTCVCIIISIAAVCVFVCEAQCGVIPADSVPLPRRMLLYAAESCANLHMPNEDESYQECV